MLSLSSKFLFALAIVRVAVAAPLGIEYDKTTGLTAGELANKGRLDTATVQANAQVANMRDGLDKYKAGNAKATALYEASFGKNADVNEVDRTISALQTGNLKAQVATHPFTNGEIAAIPWSKDGNKPWTAGNAQFSAKFHGGRNGLDAAGRAGTIIHEATHQLSKTGDDVNMSGKIIRPYDGASKPSGLDGYTSNPNMHKTVAEVNADTAYKNVRDSAPNMHHNAESYAVFASLCSQPGALTRRDFHLFNRALIEGDDEQLMYLARRNSCKLPANHFAKKAAAKKAAAGKENTALKANTPGAHAKVHAHGDKPGAKTAKIPHGAHSSANKAAHSAKGRTAGKGGKVVKAAHGSKVVHPHSEVHPHVGKTAAKSKIAPKGGKAHAQVHSHAGKVASHSTKSRATSVKGTKGHAQVHPQVGKSSGARTRKSNVKTGHIGKMASHSTKGKTPVKGAKPAIHAAKAANRQAHPQSRPKKATAKSAKPVAHKASVKAVAKALKPAGKAKAPAAAKGKKH